MPDKRDAATASPGTDSHDVPIDVLVHDVLDSFHEGCQVIGFDYTYLYLNDTAVAHSRTTRDALIGRTMMECYPGIDTTPMWSALRRCMDQRTDERLDNEFTYPDGSIAWFELRFVPISHGVFILSLDVSDKKRAEADRLRLESQLQQKQRMETIGRLAGGVAHDFNNLLTVILSYAETLLDEVTGGTMRDDVTEIRAAARRAAVLTGQLLTFSRRQVVEQRAVSVNEVVFGMEGMLKRVIGEDVILTTTLDAGLPNVKGDPGQLEQVLMNLVVNARDAMPDGGRLTIETAAVELDRSYAREHLDVTPGHYAMLAVSDTGMGMTAETQTRLFEPFFTTKEKGKGTGLGLATVYGIVKQSGGHVWVYSEVGRGTTFKIYLPEAEEGVRATPYTATAVPLEEGRRTVLVVEDDDTLRMIATRILSGAGFVVLTAPNATEAEQKFLAHDGPIHLLLTDMVMPGSSGRQLGDKLLEHHPSLRVLYMSGYTDETITRNGELTPGTAFISKPFSRAELVAKINAVLGA